MAKVTGIVWVRVNGSLIESEKGAKIIFGGKQRTAIMGADRVIGHQDEPMPGGIECTIPHTSNVDIDELRNYTGANIKYETDTGVSWIITNAFTTDVVEMEDGKIALVMAGDPAEKEGSAEKEG